MTRLTNNEIEHLAIDKLIKHLGHDWHILDRPDRQTRDAPADDWLIQYGPSEYNVFVEVTRLILSQEQKRRKSYQEFADALRGNLKDKVQGTYALSYSLRQSLPWTRKLREQTLQDALAEIQSWCNPEFHSGITRLACLPQISIHGIRPEGSRIINSGGFTAHWVTALARQLIEQSVLRKYRPDSSDKRWLLLVNVYALLDAEDFISNIGEIEHIGFDKLFVIPTLHEDMVLAL